MITLTAFADGSIQVEDNGRGCPLDWNPTEKRFNWELVFCELYAGGKYDNNQGGDYDFPLGTNGLLVRHAVRLRIYGRHRLA